MSRSFGESYRLGSASADLAIKVFCSCDHKVIQCRSVRLQIENIRTQLKELLAERRSRHQPLRLHKRLERLAVFVVSWALSVITVLGSAIAVHFFSEYVHQATGKEALLLALPLLVSVINLFMPYLYNLLAVWEKHEAPVLEVYVAVCRLILEKKRQRQQRPEFDIARNVLELIYGQTLTWLGVLFSPLLPAVQILKLLFLFYIKKTSLMMNCQSPSKPWRASHMSTIFITLLCFPSFLGAAVFLSYTIWSVRPSKICGPFQTRETIYEAGKTWVRELEKSTPSITWFTWIHQYLVENTFFMFFVSGVLLAVIYFNIQLVKGRRRIISLLKEQIIN
uniref:Transmembrane channel-like protein n=1 Tax=Sphenodon punctatus TaxID=8508 RepID=A0A8D0H5V7_SPHPU